MKKLLILLVILGMCLTGCAGPNTLGGAAIGGIGGGIAGAQIGSGTGNIAAIIGGTLLGVALGGYMGSYMDRMDRTDRVTLNKTLEHTPTNQTVQWRNPDTKTSYTVTPQRTYQRQGRYCREYQTEVMIGGKVQQSYGQACRQPDGQWEITN